MKTLAIWNPGRRVWENSQGTVDLFSEHSEPFSETWPTSGMTRNGVAYVLPTPEHHMADTGSSLLPTALASDGEKGGPNQRGAKGDLRSSSAVYLPTPRASRGASGTETIYKLGGERVDTNRTQGQVLMPTPRTSDTNGAGAHGTGGPDLRTVVSLLPTLPGVSTSQRSEGGKQ